MNKEIKSEETISSRWYVASTNFQAERLAKCNLERVKGIEVYLPVRAAAPKSKTSTVPFLPGYIFVMPDPISPRWNEIYTAIGVRAILGVGGRPAAAPLALVPQIRAHELDGVVHVERRKVEALPFKRGDRVKIKGAGPFVGFDALFQAGDHHRVLVLLSFFGRQTSVELTPEELASVCAVDDSRESPRKKA